VDSLPLIGSSIVSKKVATGAGHLLYDVKRGSGAFMKTTEEARELAELLVRLSEDLDVKASALITEMDNPLGSAVGNALEVRESVSLLKNEPVPGDLTDEVNEVATRLLELKGIPDAATAVESALTSGAAYEKFRQFVGAQGGDAEALENLPVSAEIREVKAPAEGYVARFAASGLGSAALALGAGRAKKGDEIDPGAGIEVLVRAGDQVGRDQPIARLYGEREAERARQLVLGALELSDEPVERPPAILDSL
jgi:thymidine phosphorylase